MFDISPLICPDSFSRMPGFSEVCSRPAAVPLKKRSDIVCFVLGHYFPICTVLSPLSVVMLETCSSALAKSPPPMAPSTCTSASSRPSDSTARSSAGAPGSSPISDAKISSSNTSPISSACSAAIPSSPAKVADVDILQAWTWGPVLVVRALFEQLGLTQIFDQFLGQAPT